MVIWLKAIGRLLASRPAPRFTQAALFTIAHLAYVDVTDEAYINQAGGEPLIHERHLSMGINNRSNLTIGLLLPICISQNR